MLSATVVGRLTKDAEVRSTTGGHQVCNFTVATDHGFGDKKTTTFVGVSVWGKEAEWCGKSLTKGDRVAVSGAGFLRKWDNNGKSGAEFCVESTRVEKMWDRKEGDGGGVAREAGGGGVYGPSRGRDEAPAPGDDDIPF